MKNILRPGSLLLYFLTFIAFLTGVMTFAGISDAAANQELASGAIVFMHGVFFAAAVFSVSILIYYLLSEKSVKFLSIFVSFFILIIAGLSYCNYNVRQKSKTEFQLERKSSEIINAGFTPVSFGKSKNTDGSIGMGFFKPDFVNLPVLYFFYENPYAGDPTDEIPKKDSITFSLKNFGTMDISYAPPWLAPAHLKLDYDILYFRIMYVSYNFIEIKVNEYDDRTAWVKKDAGEIFYWPEFLLKVHSVEFLNPAEHKVRVRPFNYSDEVSYKYEFMKPVIINDEWMYVELYDDDYNLTGKGWLQWKTGGKLLISYSLLS
ncbi:MAG TPA: hypothetical protein PK536_09395 [Ignavibacteria bacterium]|nr:hypothetical protein [Bacteroidota bacterium]HRI85644.1 hypothetical protein [Ignavibacteria bacterium]HRJ98659.1 hypothetical protein [Ignavibacteria bacterium]